MIDRKGEATTVGRVLLKHGEQLFELRGKVRDGTLARAAFRRDTDDQRALFVHDLERGTGCSWTRTADACRKRLWAGGRPVDPCRRDRR